VIKCKLISPTNLLLEHPLNFARQEETEFCVLGRKEYEIHRRQWIQWGVLIGLASSTLGVALVTFIIKALR
jgi:hypothetical protein